jgi:hypothetical protein
MRRTRRLVRSQMGRIEGLCGWQCGHVAAGRQGGRVWMSQQQGGMCGACLRCCQQSIVSKGGQQKPRTRSLKEGKTKFVSAAQPPGCLNGRCMGEREGSEGGAARRGAPTLIARSGAPKQSRPAGCVQTARRWQSANARRCASGGGQSLGLSAPKQAHRFETASKPAAGRVRLPHG